MESRYKMGWLIVCFDLPVVEKENMRQANAFRKQFLNQGYFMLQNSVYVRPCVTYDKSDKFIKNLKLVAPDVGTISIFYITDRQWGLSVCIEKANYRSSKFKKKTGEKNEEQMTFW